VIRSALGCAVLFVALAVLVTTGATARPDQFLSELGTAAAGAHPALTRVARVVEAVTQPGWVYLLGLSGVVAVWRGGRRRAAVVSLVAGAVASVTSPAFKAAFDRERPAVGLGYTTAGGGSFPSGHALASGTVVLLFVLVLVPARWRSRTIVLGSLELGVVAVDRVWVGAHWPSDVLAGFLLAGLIVLLAARFASEGDGDPAGAAGGLGPEARG
jgi:undecaprenyl-diphosphatase